jgi:hypothetical protein
MTIKTVAVVLGSSVAGGWVLALALMYVWLAVIDHHELDCTFGRIVVGGL